MTGLLWMDLPVFLAPKAGNTITQVTITFSLLDIRD